MDSSSIIFGPVKSRRFGLSLGVDLSPSLKQCNFDCVYCELKGARAVDSMREVIAPSAVVEALSLALQATPKLDVITITANGEPTLYPHLRELISNIKKIVPDSVKLLLLTNGSLLWKPEVREALAPLDMVKFSCDSLSLKAFKKVDRPHKSLELARIREGIARFCAEFSGEVVAEVLFVKGINDNLDEAREIAAFLSTLHLARVDIGSIDRPPAHKAEALSPTELEALAEVFRAYKNLNISLPARDSSSPDSKECAQGGAAEEGQGVLETHNLESYVKPNASKDSCADSQRAQASHAQNLNAQDSCVQDSYTRDFCAQDLKNCTASQNASQGGAISQDNTITQGDATLQARAIPKQHHSIQSLLELLKRRPFSEQDTRELFDEESLALLDELCQKSLVSLCDMGGVRFYKVR